MATFRNGLGSAPLWLAAFAVLVAVIGWETDWGRHVTPVRELPGATSAPVKVALLPEYAIQGGPEVRRETVERPAFVPTRRQAPPPPAQETAKPRLQRGQFVLTGTAVVDQQSIAFLREASTGRSRSVRKGDTINGLTVADVKPDGIVLVLGDETEPLPLKVAAGPRQTVQAAAPAPGAPAPPPVAGAPAPPTPRPAPTAVAAAAAAANAAGRAAPVSPIAAPGPTPPAATSGGGGMTFDEMYRRRYGNQRQ